MSWTKKAVGQSLVLALVGLGLTVNPVNAQLIREATLKTVRCISPASGIDNTGKVLGAIAGGAAVVGLTIATGGAAAPSAAALLSASTGTQILAFGTAAAGGATTGNSVVKLADEWFSGDDDLYITIDGLKAFPRDGNKSWEVKSQQEVNVYWSMLLGRKDHTVQLWEADWPTADDLMIEAKITGSNTDANPAAKYALMKGNDGSVYQLDVEFTTANPIGSELNNGSFISNKTIEGGEVKAGTYLRSPNGEYRLIMHTDGHLVVYNNQDEYQWGTQSGGNEGGYFKAIVTDSGLRVVKVTDNKLVWQSPTVSGVQKLVLENDGKLTLRDSSNGVLWANR